MLKANSEGTAASAAALWFPGRKMEGFGVAPLSARAREIAKGREELLRLLRDLPESEYELSLTDLVEKGSAAGNSAAEEKKTSPEGETNRASSAVKERKKRRSSRGSCGSSSDGVLLNFYVPSSLTRSLTAPRSSRASRGVAHRDVTDCGKRDREPAMFGCWPAFWERGRGKSRRPVLERR
ncbi:uncharacterized protein LOC120110837 [Phoenix dactylifera]|uniref:Uncharacterized protein LOC120110837 n=1 Tax=Phoenix dactylifera TaxID=42345 RepID=A0A8B9A7G5_PHODC|nr:uncharacterized protein LOC120110837 [Phoenix dactylifera]